MTSPHQVPTTQDSEPKAQTGVGRSTSSGQKLLLTIHIVFSVGLVGVALVLVGLGVAGLRGADPQTIYPAAHLVDAWVITPMAIVALATGAIQAIVTGRGLFRYWWVTIKLIITASTVAVVILVLEPRLAVSASAALAGDTFTPAERMSLAIAPSLAAALLAFNAILGVYKPSWRLPAGRPKGPVPGEPG